MRKPLVLVAFTAIISFALGGVAFSAHDFSDVPDSHPFHDDISWMAEEGVAEGFLDGSYRPEQPVSRQAMAAFMRRLAGADSQIGRVVDAALLQGRNAADFDDAVSLQGRTAADFDDAVTLGGRTPEDLDDAETLGGREPDEFMRVLTGAGGSDRTITGTSSAAPTVLYTASASQRDKQVRYTTLVDTSFDSSLLSCSANGNPLGIATDLKVGDATAGYQDRFILQIWYADSAATDGTLACWYESPSGAGSLVFRSWSVLEFATG